MTDDNKPVPDESAPDFSESCLYVYRIVQVLRTVDGDTVDVEIDLGFRMKTTQRIRLLRVDTPELRPRRGTEQERTLEKQKAKEAKEFVDKWLSEHDNLLIRTHKSDSFGRYLGEISGGGKTLSSILLENKLAEPYVK